MLFLKLKNRTHKVYCCHIDGHLSSQECGVRTKAPKIQRTSRAPRTVKDNSGAYAVFSEQGSSASQMTAANSNGWFLRDHQDALDKPLTQYQIDTQVKMEDAPKLLKKIQNRNFQGGRNFTQNRLRGPTTWKAMR